MTRRDSVALTLFVSAIVCFLAAHLSPIENTALNPVLIIAGIILVLVGFLRMRKPEV